MKIRKCCCGAVPKVHCDFPMGLMWFVVCSKPFGTCHNTLRAVGYAKRDQAIEAWNHENEDEQFQPTTP